MLNQSTLKAIGLTEEYVNSLPPGVSSQILVFAEWMAQVPDPDNTVTFAKRALELSWFKVDDEFWSIIQPTDALEAWSSDRYFLFCCPKFAKYSSYSVNELRSKQWDDLFERDQIHTLQILSALEKAMTTGKIQKNVTPEHTVREKMPGHSVAVAITVKAIVPFFTDGLNSPVGIIVLTNIRPLES